MKTVRFFISEEKRIVWRVDNSGIKYRWFAMGSLQGNIWLDSGYVLENDILKYELGIEISAAEYGLRFKV